MKSVVINGIVVKIGDKVRFVNDSNMSIKTQVPDGNFPVFSKEYTVRGFSSKGGFLLEELRNISVGVREMDGSVRDAGEFGFATWRFEPASPLYLEVIALSKRNKKVDIKIEKLVEERIHIEELAR